MKQILLYVFVTAIMPAAALAVKPQEASSCLGCHGKEKSISRLHIDEGQLAGSVHKSLSCSACHINIVFSGKAHQPVKEKVSCTTTCHKETKTSAGYAPPAAYADSIHGKARAHGGREAAACWNCHGKHNIKSIADPTSSMNRHNIALTCSGCHDEMALVIKYNIHKEKPYATYLKSVHGRASSRQGNEPVTAAVCTDCHGVHDIQGIQVKRANQPETCGHCHPLEFQEYRDSIHGRAQAKGNVDAALCTDCHGEHTISNPGDSKNQQAKLQQTDTCLSCHARPEIMKLYNVPENRSDTFLESIHGIALELGSKATANCRDCHGVHDIQAKNDPRSKVHPANVQKTCSQANCHPGMPARIAGQTIHRGPASTPLARGLKWIFNWAIIIILVLTFLWAISDFRRRIKKHRQDKQQ